MDEILSFSEAKVLMLLGNQASSWFESSVAAIEGFGIQGTFRLGGKERLVIHIPHPASWAKVKRLDKILSEDELSRIKRILNS
jgi:uracil-DNA glycosylase